MTVAVAGALATGAGATAAVGDDASADRLSAKLSGYQEVPAVSTSASGRFRARLTDDGIRYVLRYEQIEGGNVQQAHVHFAQRGVNGGVSAFLCSNLDDAPEGVQACPLTGGTVRGTIRAEHVVGPAAQGISPGELPELIAAMRSGVTYANVHSDTYRAGELPGAGGVRRRRRDELTRQVRPPPMITSEPPVR